MSELEFTFERPAGTIEKNNFYTPFTRSDEYISRHLAINVIYKNVVKKEESKKPSSSVKEKKKN
jgi:hypothetical protein